MIKRSKYIINQTEIAIRFSEVDAMNVVWHGNYLKFFEDGREALGEKYGLNYLEIAGNGFFTPIVESQIKHLATATYGDQLTVTVKFYNSPAAKIIHKYEVFNKTSNKLAAKGKTTQVFVSLEKELHLTVPSFFDKWKSQQDWIEEDE